MLTEKRGNPIPNPNDGVVNNKACALHIRYDLMTAPAVSPASQIENAKALDEILSVAPRASIRLFMEPFLAAAGVASKREKKLSNG